MAENLNNLIIESNILAILWDSEYRSSLTSLISEEILNHQIILKIGTP